MSGYWTDRTGVKIPNGSAAAMIEHRLSEIQDEVKNCEAHEVRCVADLKEARRITVDVRKELVYWEQALAIAREVDRRLSEGEKVNIGDSSSP